MWPGYVQKHNNSFTTADQSDLGSHFGSCLFLRHFSRFTKFFTVFFFTKLKRKDTLIFTMQLCCDSSDSMLGKIQGLFKDFSRIFGFQGLFKDLLQNSRTFQDCANPAGVTFAMLIPSNFTSKNSTFRLILHYVL